MHRGVQRISVVFCLLVVTGCDPCVNNPCDNGVACDGLETCAFDASQIVCTSGTRVACEFRSFCTEPDGACVNPCDLVDCSDANDCTTDTCITHADRTTTCINDPFCDDGDACTEGDTCGANGVCAGTSVECAAGEVCADGVCVCAHDSACNDGDPCTGTETCDVATGDCVAGDPVFCDDGLFCNGVEVCTIDAFTGEAICVDGTAPCDPVTEVCNEDTDICERGVSCTSDADCDDGVFCSGVETCQGGVCVDGTPPPECAGCYTANQPTTRSVSVSPPSGTLVYGVEDTPPDGWTISNISNDGEYDAANNAVKWFFLDDNARTLSFSATPPAGETGTACFEGLVNYDGGANLNTQSLCLDQCNGDPCDGNICDDGGACNGVETCDPATGDCVAGSPVSCVDGQSCVDGNCIPSDPCQGVSCAACENCVDGFCQPLEGGATAGETYYSSAEGGCSNCHGPDGSGPPSLIGAECNIIFVKLSGTVSHVGGTRDITRQDAADLEAWLAQ